MIESLRVVPGSQPGIAARDTRDDLGLGTKDAAKRVLDDLRERIADLQDRLYAESTRAVLLVLQGLDASGKDGVIRSVFSGANPLGIRTASFGVPTETELAHDYLWRIHAALPPRGTIGVFNRSHYEDVVAVRMHALAPEERLASSARAHPRVGADARRRGHDDRQGVPQRLEGGAAATPPGTRRRSAQALEVPHAAISRYGSASTSSSLPGRRSSARRRRTGRRGTSSRPTGTG